MLEITKIQIYILLLFYSYVEQRKTAKLCMGVVIRYTSEIK